MSFNESCELDFRQTWLPSLKEQISIQGNEDDSSQIKSLSNAGASRQTVYHHTDAKYYATCLVGGGLSSSVRWALTPFDYIKCSMQANPGRFTSFSAGLSLVWQKQGISGLYRGFTPTVLSYFSQSGTKYAMYELIKDNMSRTLGPEKATQYQSLVYIVSAGSAEAIADIFMCPWEMLKVKVQTSKPGSFPSNFRPALESMIQQRKNLNFPFGSLTPLWSRQVMFTVANFVTFEYTVNAVYSHLIAKNKDDCQKSTQLAVSFASGYVSGLVSTIVSHPADSLLSLRARYPDKSYRQIIDLVGWKQLATQGLIPRAAVTGTIIASQWFLYDSFKTMVGLGTSGGGSRIPESIDLNANATSDTVQSK